MPRKKRFYSYIIILLILSAVSAPNEVLAVSRGLITEFSSNSETVNQYQLFEISLKTSLNINNPFDPEEINIMAHFQSPSGKLENRPAFWYQNFRKEHITKEVVTVRGDKKIASGDFYFEEDTPEWKIRFAPMEVGEYRYYISIGREKLKDETRHPAGDSLLTFKVTESSVKGNIKVSGKDPSYFVYDNGETFLPVGHGPNLSLDFVEQYGELGFNILQNEFEQNLKIESDRVGQYNLKSAFITDLVLHKAEETGIFLQFVFNSWPDWVDDNERSMNNAHWDNNPYNKVNGGPIKYPLQFDSNKKAGKYFKNKLRYYIARWGYSDHIFSWHLWGEHDMRKKGASDWGAEYFNQRDLVEWHREMSTYIKSLDPRHLVSTAEAFEINDAIWRLNTIDFITVHHYNKLVDWKLIENIREYQNLNLDKPILVQEYGPEPMPGIRVDNAEAHRACFHIPLWQTMMVKLSGTAMKWTWQGSEIERDLNLDRDYQIVKEFFAGSDLANSNIKILNPVDLTPKKNFKPWVLSNERRTRTIRKGGMISPVDISGIGNNKTAYLWVRDIRYNSLEIRRTGYIAEKMEGVKIRLDGMSDGDYSVEIWDTRTGEVKRMPALARAGSILISVPAFKKDTAVKIMLK